MTNWDGLQTFLALAENGNLLGAAKVLGVSHQTVSRQVTQLEARLGTRLFDREAKPWRLTLAGRDLERRTKNFGEGIDQSLAAMRIAQESGPGPVRLSVAPFTFKTLVLPALKTLQDTAAPVAAEISFSMQPADLGIGECDMAIRITNTPPQSLIGRDLGTVTFGIFGHEQLIADFEAGGTAVPVIDVTDAPAHRRDLLGPRNATVLRVADPEALLDAVEQGLGVAVLPDVVGMRLTLCRRSTLRIPDRAPLRAWLLRHQDSRSNPEIRRLEQALVEMARTVFPDQPGRH